MEKKTIIVLNQTVVDEIDGHRGDMSREACGGGCVEDCVRRDLKTQAETRGEGAPSVVPEKQPAVGFGPSAEYASREEFLEFKQGITSLMRNFLEFFLSYGLEHGTSNTSS